jgi:hypothetical protein
MRRRETTGLETGGVDLESPICKIDVVHNTNRSLLDTPKMSSLDLNRILKYLVFSETYIHRWARLLKQQSSMTAYRFPTKENKIPSAVSVCSKQTYVGRSRFPFAVTKRKFRFPVVPFFLCIEQQKWRLKEIVSRTLRLLIRIYTKKWVSFLH